MFLYFLGLTGRVLNEILVDKVKNFKTILIVPLGKPQSWFRLLISSLIVPATSQDFSGHVLGRREPFNGIDKKCL